MQVSTLNVNLICWLTRMLFTVEPQGHPATYKYVIMYQCYSLFINNTFLTYFSPIEYTYCTQWYWQKSTAEGKSKRNIQTNLCIHNYLIYVIRWLLLTYALLSIYFHLPAGLTVVKWIFNMYIATLCSPTNNCNRHLFIHRLRENVHLIGSA
jgi:hypothetical protein